MHAVVVGAGVFGAWTAHHLDRTGFRVTLIDAYGPGNSRSSSGDESRILRCGYGSDAIYSDFASRSRAQWQELEIRAGAGHQPLWYPCGVLWLAAGDDAYTAATRETLERGGYRVDVLDAAMLRARYPHLAVSGIGSALFEPEGGVLMARRAVRSLADDLVRRGVTLVRGRVVQQGPASGHSTPRLPAALRNIRTADGDGIEGDVFVFACGAWLPKVFPDLLGARIRATRQTVIYFGPPAGDVRFGAARTPAWIDFPSGIYGVPDIDDRGLKVGIDAHGPEFDPDSGDRIVDEATVATARAWLGRRFPDMAGAPVIETRVCQYENTSSGDFLIDRHPELENVWLVGGGSGHGFKHGPAVGEYAARLIATREATADRFSIALKAAAFRRAVY